MSDPIRNLRSRPKQVTTLMPSAMLLLLCLWAASGVHSFRWMGPTRTEGMPSLPFRQRGRPIPDVAAAEDSDRRKLSIGSYGLLSSQLSDSLPTNNDICVTDNMPTINVSDASHFADRLNYPPNQAVTLALVSDVTLPDGLVFDSNYSCTILVASITGLTLTLAKDTLPVLQIYGTHNVLVHGVNFVHPATRHSPPCVSIKELGRTDMICPAIIVQRSYGVQITKGGVYGRIDITRSMSVLVDSMKVTGVSDNSVSPGMIRVQLSGVGPSLIPANITISNNEVFGRNDGIVLHFGAVGVNVLNNYIHDYGFAGIRCGDYVSAQGDCMMTTVRENYVYSPSANVMGDHDAAGIYYNTHWFNPENYATCNYVRGGDHCYYLDNISSGLTIEGGVCIGTSDGVKINGGQRNKVTSIILKDVPGSPGWCSCLFTPVTNCQFRPGSSWVNLYDNFYNSTDFEALAPWYASVCTATSAANGRPCNPSSGAPANVTGGCSGLPTGNILELFQLDSTEPAGYKYCDNYTQVPSLNTYSVLTGLPSDWYQFLDVDSDNLGVKESSYLFALRPDFVSCDRGAVGPRVINDTVYFDGFNVGRPDGFIEVLHMDTNHLLDLSFQGEYPGPMPIG